MCPRQRKQDPHFHDNTACRIRTWFAWTGRNFVEWLLQFRGMMVAGRLAMPVPVPISPPLCVWVWERSLASLLIHLLAHSASCELHIDNMQRHSFVSRRTSLTSRSVHISGCGTFLSAVACVSSTFLHSFSQTPVPLHAPAPTPPLPRCFRVLLSLWPSTSRTGFVVFNIHLLKW